MVSLSIVVPVYNAERTIGELCRELINLLAGNNRLQIVLINDCSRDGTDEVCRGLLEEFPDIVTYGRLSRNFGEHNAVMAGLNQAHGDYVIIMDDDFQNPPEEVPRLLQEIEKGYDVVYCEYPKKNDSFLRNLGSYLNGTMARVVLNKPANLYLSSFKAMNRFLVSEIIKCKTPAPYIDAIILRTTRNIGIVEVRHDHRRSGTSGYTFKKLLALWGDMIVSFSLIPLRFLAILGMVMTLIGVFSMAEMMLKHIHPLLVEPSDIDELTTVSMFFRGFQLFATGIVGEYVGRIYLRLNDEPQYILRELLGGSGRKAGHE